MGFIYNFIKSLVFKSSKPGLSGTFTTPANVIYLEVEMLGGGASSRLVDV